MEEALLFFWKMLAPSSGLSLRSKEARGSKGRETRSLPSPGSGILGNRLSLARVVATSSPSPCPPLRHLQYSAAGSTPVLSFFLPELWIRVQPRYPMLSEAVLLGFWLFCSVFRFLSAHHP